MLFLRKSEVLRIHARAISEFGGKPGVLNDGALESALVAVENRAYYENAGLAVCAAACAFHLAKAHAFVDGNKRVAAATTETFIIINGGHLEAGDGAIYELIVGLAASEVTRADAEEWFGSRVVPRNR